MVAQETLYARVAAGFREQSKLEKQDSRRKPLIILDFRLEYRIKGKTLYWA
jgi:hypothetical protein